MKNPTLRETLSAVTRSVFEQTAFIFPEPVDMLEGLTLGDFEMITTNLSFSGDNEGSLSLILPFEFCRELSANMLGEETSETGAEDMRFDAASEILNIIAGQLLTRLYGDKALFNLTAPQARSLSREELFEAIGGKEYACSMADDYPVITILSMGKEAYEHQSTGG